MYPQIPSLTDITPPDITHGFQEGLYTSSELVKAYLARIAELYHEYHSVIETKPDALIVAEVPSSSPPEIFTTASPSCSKTTSPPSTLQELPAALALVGAKSVKEAAIVTVLRRAGSVLLGKVNMAEWVGFRSTSGCSGWSLRGGQSTCIFYKNMKASESSGRFAVGTALGLCFTFLGAETCYSIVSPAEKSGFIGNKPM